jgi:hypothetical protein
VAVTLFRGARLSGRSGALELLRPFRDDPVAMQELRLMAAERHPSIDVSLLADDAVLDLVSRSVASGALAIEAFDAGYVESPTGEEVQTLAEPEETVVEVRPLDWIAIEMVGEDDAPIAGERYRVELPDGKTREGTLDSKGRARIEGIPSGQCKISFPKLDKDAWEPA